jgi:hypothetical protein
VQQLSTLRCFGDRNGMRVTDDPLHPVLNLIANAQQLGRLLGTGGDGYARRILWERRVVGLHPP